MPPPSPPPSPSPLSPVVGRMWAQVTECASDRERVGASDGATELVESRGAMSCAVGRFVGLFIYGFYSPFPVGISLSGFI